MSLGGQITREEKGKQSKRFEISAKKMDPDQWLRFYEELKALLKKYGITLKNGAP